MWRNSQALFALVILAFGIWALVGTQGWRIHTALYPRVIGIPLVVLAAIEVVLSLRGKQEAEHHQAMDTGLSTVLPAPITLRRTIVAFAWIVGFFLLIVLVGFPVAIPVFVFANLKFQGRESWVLSVALAAIAWLIFELVFDRVLHLPFAEGLLWQVLRR